MNTAVMPSDVKIGTTGGSFVFLTTLGEDLVRTAVLSEQSPSHSASCLWPVIFTPSCYVTGITYRMAKANGPIKLRGYSADCGMRGILSLRSNWIVHFGAKADGGKRR